MPDRRTELEQMQFLDKKECAEYMGVKPADVDQLTIDGYLKQLEHSEMYLRTMVDDYMSTGRHQDVGKRNQLQQERQRKANAEKRKRHYDAIQKQIDDLIEKNDELEKELQV